MAIPTQDKNWEQQAEEAILHFKEFFLLGNDKDFDYVEYFTNFNCLRIKEINLETENAEEELARDRERVAREDIEM